MKEETVSRIPARTPDCVTETRMGNTILVVSGFFKQDAASTATDKMMRVLEAESMAGSSPEHTV